jgi:hypothetical protein
MQGIKECEKRRKQIIKGTMGKIVDPHSGMIINEYNDEYFEYRGIN